MIAWPFFRVYPVEMATETALDLINSQEWLKPVSDAVQSVVHSAYESAGEPGRQVKNAMHGVWLGHPLHPVLTDIPLGAWTTALVCDAMEEITGRKEFGIGADLAIGVGLAGAVGAAVTGLTDWSETDGRARQIGITHGLLNIAGAVLYTSSLACRKSGDRGVGRGLSLLGFAVAIGSAWLGGNMVYTEQVGVNHAAGGAALPSDWVTVMAEADLKDGELRRVDANGYPVLLVRRGGEITALGERCSHAGGPLAEGKLSGNTITCPWHGSQFCIENGEVVNGPATHPVPSFETRLHGGQIEIRVRPS